MTYSKEREDFFNPPSAEVRAPGNGSSVAKVGFKRLSEDAVIPRRAFSTDSGFDICALEDVLIAPGETVVVKTGIAVTLPKGFEASVRPRSGITSRTKLRVQYGTVDNGYGGDIGVIVDNIREHNARYNTADKSLVDGSMLIGHPGISPAGTYLIQKGDRIAQLVITRLPDVEAVEVFDVGDSDRGALGFGSSGA